MMKALGRECLIRLHEILTHRFDDGELRTLCFNLGVDYDDLPGDGKVNKARELVAHCERRDDIPELLKTIKQLRQDISWVDMFDLLPKVADDAAGVRYEAAQKLATLKDRSTVPILVHRLEVEPDPTVRYWLAYALGQIGDEDACIALRAAYVRELDPWTKDGIAEGLQAAGCKTSE